MTLAFEKLLKEERMKEMPITDYLAATSVGMHREHGAILDLNYEEDSTAEVDMNIIMTGQGKFVELQGTGEEATFSKQELDELISLGKAELSILLKRKNKCFNRSKQSC